jgi:hypothetical protein
VILFKYFNKSKKLKKNTRMNVVTACQPLFRLRRAWRLIQEAKIDVSRLLPMRLGMFSMKK